MAGGLSLMCGPAGPRRQAAAWLDRCLPGARLRRARAAWPAETPFLAAGGAGMVVIGMDAHKRTHTMVAVDELGRRLGERTGAAASDGTCRRCSGRPGGPGERFALEDCRHLTRRLEGDLLRAGFAVVRVHNTWVG